MNQAQIEIPLFDPSGLANRSLIEAHEIRAFALEPRKVYLPPFKQPIKRIGTVQEMLTHHPSPPNTSTLENKQAGEAWPTRTICDGSPLPQKGVPMISKVSSSPTIRRARQKLAEMPR